MDLVETMMVIESMKELQKEVYHDRTALALGGDTYFANSNPVISTIINNDSYLGLIGKDSSDLEVNPADAYNKRCPLLEQLGLYSADGSSYNPEKKLEDAIPLIASQLESDVQYGGLATLISNEKTN